MGDPLDTPLTIIPREAFVTVHRPGVPVKACRARGCSEHTSDWRAPRRSPLNRHGASAEAVLSLREVLLRKFPTEALCMGYVVTRDGEALSHSPRVAKDSVEWLRSEGLEVMTTCFIADVDTPGHQPWAPEQREEFARLWETAPALRTVAMYTSARGYRLMQPLATWLPVEEAEARQLAWLHELIAQGVWPSALECKDWTHLMRVPNPRKAGAPYLSDWVSMERAACVEAPPPFAGAMAPRARAARSTRQPARGAVVDLPAFVETCPPAWQGAADAAGEAIMLHVTRDWRRCYLALAGALLDRGCPPGAVPGVIARAHLVDPAWVDLLEGRMEIARSTALRWISGLAVIGDAVLRKEFPAVAEAIDTVTVSPTEARVRRELAAPCAAPIPVAEAVAIIAQEIEAPFGVVLIEAPPGTGKTHAVADRARRLPTITSRAAAGARIAIAAPRHDLAEQTAAKLPGRTLHLFSPPSLLGDDGKPVCLYADSARALAKGRQSVRFELCEGRGKPAQACEMVDTCPAKEGMQGNPKGNMVVGVHGLVRQLRAYAGAAGTLFIDEPEEITEVTELTLDNLDTARRYLDAFTDRYASAMAPMLAAFTAWVREVGPVEGALMTVQDAVRAAAHAVPGSDLEAAGIDPSEDLGTAILLAALGAIPEDAKRKAPALRWLSIVRARANPARASEIGDASRVLDLLWRAVTDRVAPAARIDERRGERTASIVGINADYLCGLSHDNVVVLDANAGLHAAAVEKVLGFAPKLVRLAVADGAPIARTLLACGGATRSSWLPRGAPDWSSGILSALRAAVGWILRERATRSVGFMAPKVVAAALEHTLHPDAPGPVTRWGHSRRALSRAREALDPILAPLAGVEVIVGHYGALEGLDHMADCDATVTFMDPRPNLGTETLRAEFLGLDPAGRVDDLAAAELQQAHGRLRTIHRTRPGRQLHVGALIPAGWAGLEVSVERLSVGRPKTIAAMSPEEFREHRTALGLSARECARDLRITHTAVARYEDGQRAVPEDVARGLRALALSGTETPRDMTLTRGFGSTRVATRGFGSTPLLGVSVPPHTENAP